MMVSEKLRDCAEAHRTAREVTSVDGTADLLEEAAEYIDRIAGMIAGRKDRDIVFRNCIDHYGKNPQVDVMIEEMSELTKALLKWRRAEDPDSVDILKCIVDEIADVRIMARQMELLFRCEHEVDLRIDYKVQRQKERLEKTSRRKREVQDGED